MRIPQHLEVRPGKLTPQRRQHRQGEDEVADGAAPNHENLALVLAHRLVLGMRPRRGHQYTVKPSSATNSPNARRMALPMRTRFSLAVAQFSRSRRCHGQMVNQMPPRTSR